jgi:tRNA dimethylallyltransferase
VSEVIAIVGPTGTGKTALADALAAELGGELVSADSMQVYRGMDIGTAKMEPARRRTVHHCIDIADPGEAFTAALYQRAARSALADIQRRGKTAVFCGGTGLYLRAALDDFSFDEGGEEPAHNAQLRAQLMEEAEAMGNERFHALLAERDPQSAALIHPNNVRRVVRAFELLAAGKSYAKQSEGFGEFREYCSTSYIGIHVDPELLAMAIDARVDSMMAKGLVEEVQSLMAKGFRSALCARQAIGYKELLAWLDGEASLEEAVAQIKQATRRYAKRQRTWFRRDGRIKWLDATDLHRALLNASLTEAAFGETLLTRARGLLE